ncbi:cysteine desulfuration protein SufE [Chloropicon primus]|uniref:Cysteine desulfuration protein SufE n=1 Tax=Chloropicon primus TaxID=1764295 RepID=A0A5B8MI81_9CHLO|nr:cysteine desulfuration protein SufE [Chloropicon primus]UPQ99359.1 cysteine desulfuration protein SufE [Chloropicon primus]|eukprot:QDZ20147.1 cysteine desulfuration protein SufE [Chloropicon primus]
MTSALATRLGGGRWGRGGGACDLGRQGARHCVDPGKVLRIQGGGSPPRRRRRSNSRRERGLVCSVRAMEASTAMPESLKGLVAAFSAVPDPMMRYKQLLFFAEKLDALGTEHQTPENKVEGCVSQVWVKGFLEQDGTVTYKAESDSQLTKGLAALLVKGLSGATPEAITSLDPSFIEKLGLQQSLTPSRNNGFLNMLLKMQKIAQGLLASTAAGGDAGATPDADANLPMSKKIELVLTREFSPASLEIQDDSASHAGHRPESADGGTHFTVRIVSESFEGMNTIKRHKAIYAVLADCMEPAGTLHALSLSTKTPSEV